MPYAKSRATIERILSAARKMFLAKNYADVSIAGIAVASGVTKGAVYHHFRSKDALYVTMLLEYMREFQDISETVAKEKGTCRERLRRLALSFFHQPREQRSIFKLVRRDINLFKNPIRNQLIRAYQAALPHPIEAIIRDGIRDGELVSVDPRLLSWLKVAMVEIVLTRYAERVFKNADETVNFVIDLMFDGVGNKCKVRSRIHMQNDGSVKEKFNRIPDSRMSTSR